MSQSTKLLREVFRWCAENTMPNEFRGGQGIEFVFGRGRIGERNLNLGFGQRGGGVQARIFDETMGCGERRFEQIRSKKRLVELLQWVSQPIK